ncbi:MAG TPA: hypothetical protein VM388_06480 [Acidimicrobiales bacterium]|jgi:hypothetical protein|nr:hypothetical protein [Acidimicrobiales bacterium]
MSEPTDDDPNEPRLMTRIDGEEARLLVHIEPIEEAGEDATEPCEPDEGDRPVPPGLAE